MMNKDKLKCVIEQDINSNKYYNQIVRSIEEKVKKKSSNLWNLSLAMMCLIVIMGGFLFYKFQNTNLVLEDIDNKNDNIVFKINELNDKCGLLKLDMDVKIVKNNNLDFPIPFKDNSVSIPKDLDKVYKYSFYTRENIKDEDYNILYNYEIVYSNDSEKTINISYSKEHKPLRDYYFKENGNKITIINNVELKIYKFENNYFTEFKFNEYNFDIETSEVTEQELKDLLLSIIK